ncbi:MAG: ABC transporter permease, partial [Opitutaceae bacterium]
MKILSKFTALFRKQKLDADMAEEMRSHLERRTQANLTAGMSPDEARYAAQRQFGGVEQLKETAREQRGFVWLEQSVRDVRYAFRKLARAKGFTAVALLTLAIGIGGTTAIFGVIDARLLRPIPGSVNQRSVHILEHNQATGKKSQASAQLHSQLSQLPDVFEKTFMLDLTTVDRIADGDLVETPRGCGVTPGFFEFLGVPPLLGRWLVNNETNSADENAIVISHGWWLARFGGDSNVIGRQVKTTNALWTIVGVMPQHFQFPNAAFQFWRPFDFQTAAAQPAMLRNYYTFARLAPGVSEQSAQSALDVLAERMARQFPKEYANVSVKLEPLRDYIIPPEVRGTLWASTAAIALILLIVCANMANLQLARSGLRARELAICGALGASRWRIARQLLAESLVLSLVGGVAGLLLALWLRQPLEKLVPINAPLLAPTGINGAMLAWTIGISVLCGIAFGFFPAWHAADIRVNETLKQAGPAASSGRKEKWFRHGLVVAQVALATVLLSGAGLLVRSVAVLLLTDPGVNPTNLAAVTIRLTPLRLLVGPKAQQLPLTRAIAAR